ncbi:uncharacterized protein LOC133909713 [Phragmites australis]|uniref:uncharacterized protein LOC133909713 n=1 Tax=Phragmites australis TaxID=29695 RepID=UPI002D765424|nr:uncharacterized protein LOC133909713 [Phragmites australis]
MLLFSFSIFYFYLRGMVLAMFVAVWSQRTSASSSTTCPPTSQPSSVPPSMPPAPLTSSPPRPRRRPPASFVARLLRHRHILPGIQAAVLAAMDACLKELRRTNKVDVEDPTVEKGLFRRQLDPIWHTLGKKTKQLVADLRTLRKLISCLYDAVTYLKCLDTLRVLEGVRSVWILADSSHKIFELAKRRVYQIVRADCTKVSTDNKDTPAKKRKVTHISTKKGKETENEDSTADKGGIRKINADVGIVLEEVLEEAPKWKVLRELLQEIAQEQTKGDGENAQDEDKSDESGIVSVTCKYERSCLQLQECISKGFHQTGAELHLAAYEALAYVLATLSTAHNSQFLDLVEVKQTNRVRKFSLDILVTTFLDNINYLLTYGILTRSRQDVVMNWKWFCVDSLLSVSCCCSESQLKRLDSLFSNSTLRCIFLDVIESLENAGENSVLSILRSVRYVLGLLHLNMGSMNITSLGISYEVLFTGAVSLLCNYLFLKIQLLTLDGSLKI